MNSLYDQEADSDFPRKEGLKRHGLLHLGLKVVVTAVVLVTFWCLTLPLLTVFTTEVQPIKLFLMLRPGEMPLQVIYNGKECVVYDGFDGEQYAPFVSRLDRATEETATSDVPQYVVLYAEGVPIWATYLGVKPTPMEDWRSEWHLHK